MTWHFKANARVCKHIRKHHTAQLSFRTYSVLVVSITFWLFKFIRVTLCTNNDGLIAKLKDMQSITILIVLLLFKKEKDLLLNHQTYYHLSVCRTH